MSQRSTLSVGFTMAERADHVQVVGRGGPPAEVGLHASPKPHPWIERPVISVTFANNGAMPIRLTLEMP
jgi:hypothetical protein